MFEVIVSGVCFRAEKGHSAGRDAGSHSNLLQLSGMVSLQGSQNSLDMDCTFDENILYESAENRESPLSIKNNQVWV